MTTIIANKPTKKKLSYKASINLGALIAVVGTSALLFIFASIWTAVDNAHGSDPDTTSQISQW
jgi:fucose permease